MSLELFDGVPNARDAEYLSWMAMHPDGFVGNFARGKDSSYFLLHRAGCHHISKYSRSNRKDSFTTGPYLKACSISIDDLTSWARTYRPAANGPTRCKTCNPLLTISEGHDIFDPSATYVAGVREYLNQIVTGEDWLISKGDRTITLEYKPIYHDELTKRFGMKAQFWMEEPVGQTATLKFEFVEGIDHVSLREALADDFRRLLFTHPIENLLPSKDSTVARIHLSVPLKQDERVKIENFYNLVKQHISHWSDTNLLKLLKVKEDIDIKSALDDLGPLPLGSIHPDRASVVVSTFKRDIKIRNYVMKRAGGACEYCGEKGFMMQGNVPYLEAHHIISLGKDGPDTFENVIALCPNHHRQAHFGLDAKNIEMAMTSRLKTINKKG